MSKTVTGNVWQMLSTQFTNQVRQCETGMGS